MSSRYVRSSGSEEPNVEPWMEQDSKETNAEQQPEPNEELYEIQWQKPCKICRFRNRQMPPEENDERDDETHTPVNEMVEGYWRTRDEMDAMTRKHSKPGDFWYKALSLGKLHRPRFVEIFDKQLATFKCRNMDVKLKTNEWPSHFMGKTSHVESSDGTPVYPNIEDGTYTMYHLVETRYLLQPSEKIASEGGESNGILVDGCLRIGILHGKDGRAVFFYSSDDAALYLEPGWVMLKCQVLPFLRRQQGHKVKGKYCIKGDAEKHTTGTICPWIEIKQVIMLASDLPDFFRG